MKEVCNSEVLGRYVTVTVDRPMGSHHPEHKNMYYPVNYGYIEGIMAPDGEEQDAYTYICRGHVFANAQTGNLVLLGVYLMDQKWFKALHYFIPVLSFVLGILICEMIQSRLKWKQRFHWRQIVVFIEFTILLISGFLPLGMWDTAVNILVSFVCALQVEAFRKMNGNTFATTMCTGNLRSGTENLSLSP